MKLAEGENYNLPYLCIYLFIYLFSRPAPEYAHPTPPLFPICEIG